VRLCTVGFDAPPTTHTGPCIELSALRQHDVAVILAPSSDRTTQAPGRELSSFSVATPR